MIIAPVFTAIVLALIFTIFIPLLFKRRGPGGIWVFFLILFLSLWAGGLWLYPAGPYFWGVSWLPLLVLGTIIALILIAVEDNTQNRPEGYGNTTERPVTVNEKQQRDAAKISLYFWIIMILLAVAILSGYYINQNPEL